MLTNQTHKRDYNTTPMLTSAMAGLLGTMAVGLSFNASAALPANAVLRFNPAVANSCLGGAGTYPSCAYGILVNVAYFTMDLNSNNNGDLTERTALNPGPDTGIKLGFSQPASGSHSGAPNGSESGSIDEAWGFGGNTGLHQTTSAVSIISDDNAGNAILDFSGWSVAWNGIADIPMGTGAYTGNNNGRAILNCASTCANGDTFVLSYSATVPNGDPSGFGNVKYSLHLEGSVYQPPAVTAAAGALNNGTIAGTAVNNYTIDQATLTTAGIPLDSNFTNSGGFFDFTVTGLGAGNSVAVSIPLSSTIPSNAVYRKYNSANGWFTFVEDGNNSLASADSSTNGGLCAGAAYSAGLNAGDDCLQMTIEDGGPNDADGAANTTVVDPGGISSAAAAVASTAPAESGTSGGGCSLSTSRTSIGVEWFALLVSLIGIGYWRKRDHS